MAESSVSVPPQGEPIDELREAVEAGDGIFVVRGSGTCRGWNNIRYKIGLSAKNTPAKHLSMNVATIPPGGVAYAHVHVGFEVMLYILEGRVRHEYGEGLARAVENVAGDFIFIEPGVPHEVFNLSDAEPVVAVVARSDASEWENIVPYERPAR
jgi:uncharacterized RmlC-like cupin family protein